MTTLGALLGSAAQAGRLVPGKDNAAAKGPGADTGMASAQERIARTQQMLSERLSQRVAEKMPLREDLPLPPAGSDFSPQTVADRVVGFISGRLQTEQGEGASDATLRQRFREGLEGALAGMKEAREELEARGMFEGEVRDNYFDTFGRVQQGLDELRDRFFGSGTEADGETPAAAGTDGASALRATSGRSISISESRNFSLEVVTNDGDVVRIDVSAARDFSSTMSRTRSADGIAVDFSREMSSSNAFSFAVEGELDEGEMRALNDLFSQVNDIASTFYGGDVEAAFNQALEVGYDAGELAGFAANMTQSQTVAVTRAYSQVAGAGSNNASRPAFLEPLVDFSRKVRSAEVALADSMANLGNGNELFRNLLARLPLGNGDVSGVDTSGVATSGVAAPQADTGSADPAANAGAPAAGSAGPVQAPGSPSRIFSASVISVQASWEQFIDGLLKPAA